MSVHTVDLFDLHLAGAKAIDVTIVMPCLDEAISLPHCIANAQAALAGIEAQYGLAGEIVIADNGSTDGSQALATKLGARVVPVTRRGYGAALIGGCEAAFGRYILMGDADGSYDFTNGVAMIGALVDGADLCMGSRFKGGIAPGAMPWKNRYIGNPVLTGILNLFFRSGISDAHCGLRAITRDCFASLNLSGTGMEFASEMVIKAALKRCRISEVPATLSVDLRDRAPHLRPWRDGWRHLRYLLMLSPTWVFGVPGAMCLIAGLALLTAALIQLFVPRSFPAIGDYWTILGSALTGSGHLLLLLTCAGRLYALQSAMRSPGRLTRLIARFATLEHLLVGGLAMIGIGAIILAQVSVLWVARDFAPAPSIFLPVVGTLACTMGVQTIFAAFLMSIISGNSARFITEQEAGQPVRPG